MRQETFGIEVLTTYRDAEKMGWWSSYPEIFSKGISSNFFEKPFAYNKTKCFILRIKPVQSRQNNNPNMDIPNESYKIKVPE